MGSPMRIFKNSTTATIEAAIVSATARLTAGEFTSLSGGQKSSTRKFYDAENILFEANYELSVRNGTVPPTRTTQDFSRLRQNNITV